MKKNIRHGVFETNSSSCHSITAGNNQEGTLWDCGTLYTYFGEYGWGPGVLYTPAEKTSYLVTMAIELNQVVSSAEEFYETDDFKAIEAAIREKAAEDDIPFDRLLLKENDAESIHINDYGWTKNNGYVDHQSVVPISDFAPLKDFIFSGEVCVVLEND